MAVAGGVQAAFEQTLATRHTERMRIGEIAGRRASGPASSALMPQFGDALGLQACGALGEPRAANAPYLGLVAGRAE